MSHPYIPEQPNHQNAQLLPQPNIPFNSGYVILPTGAAPMPASGMLTAIGPDGQLIHFAATPPQPVAYQQAPPYYPTPQQPAPVEYEYAPTLADYLTPGLVKFVLAAGALGGAAFGLYVLLQALIAAAAVLQTLAMLAGILFGGVVLLRALGAAGGSGKVNNRINIDVQAVAGKRVRMPRQRRPRR
ncbi:hypothetical protein AB0O82_32695 [Kitasatospora sp. NPDC088264]|uniref:hypothetical protein n=1 Tax=Kitasatospora sp. NPDC088264 TaxID=3155296 RepID=UPI0034316600